MNIIYVMIGGFLGAISRFTLGEWIPIAGFPIGTLVVNLTGCLFLGWFLTFFSQKKHMKSELILFFGTGFTSSFTTFSTFSIETINLISDSTPLFALLYVLISILLGITFSFFGYKLALSKLEKGDIG